MVGCISDITERKRAEETLRESEEIFRHFMEYSPIYVFFKDENIRALRLSKNYETMLGKPIDELLGKNMDELFPSELAKNMVADDMRILKEGKAITVEEELNSRFYTTTKFPIHGEGKPRYLAGFTIDITERKQGEEALRESEEKYRTILENIEEGYYEVDIAGNYTFFNESVCRLLGYSREEMMGMNNRYYTDKTNAQKLYRTFNEVYRTGVPAQGSDWELIRKDNTKRYVECSVSSIKNKSGQPIGFRGIIRDITERKQAEEELRKSEERFKLIFENAPDAFYLNDLKGYFIEGNKAAERITGFKREELIGGSFLKLNMLSLDQLPKAVTLLAKNAIGKPTGPDEFILKRKAGDKVLVEITTHPIKFEKRTVVLGIARDITERKRAEEALRESENRLHTIVEGTQALLVSVDANGHFTYANDATARALGYASPAELNGKPYLHFIHPEDRQQVQDTFSNQVTTRQPSSIQEFRIVDTEGKVKWFSFLASLEIKDGQVVGQSGVAQDITERKRAESERQALLEIMQAVAATESLQELLELIRQSLAKVIYAKNFFVIFHNRSTGLFEEVFAVDKYDPPMPPSKLKKSITSYVFRTGEPLLLTQAKFEELATRGEVELIGTNSASWLGTPLKTPSETIGVIAVQNYEDPNCYSERDREFIASVGTQVAQAIDRKRVEQALQESEASLREAQALGQVGNWEYDVESQKITWSDQVYRLYERDPVLEPPTAEEEAAYYSPEQAQILHEYARRAVEEGQDFEYDLEATLPSERRVYFSARMQPIKDAHGRVVKLFGTVQDITERKQAEEGLHKEEETLRLAVDATADGIWDWDIQSNKEFFSPRWCEIIGYSYDDPEFLHTYDSWASRIHPEDKDYVIAALTNHLEKGFTYDVEYRHLHKSGEYRWQKSIGKTIHNENNKPVRMVGCIRDITKSKQAEEALRASEEHLRLVTDNMQDMVARTDLQGIFLYASPSHKSVLGYEPASLLGKSIYDFMHPEDIDRVRKEVLAALQAETPGKQEYRYRHADGHYLWLESNGALISDDNGSPIGAVFSTRDITERRQAEDEINNQLAELQRWHNATLGRESRILDLKREVNELLAQDGKPPRYPSVEKENQSE